MSSRSHWPRKRLVLGLLVGAFVLGGLRADFGVPTTSAGFTDSTYGVSALATTAKVDLEAVKYDQTAASALFLSDAGGLYVSGYRGTGDGNGARPSPTSEPNRVEFPRDVFIVDATGSTNDFHASNAATTSFMALDADGDVWTWGKPLGGEKLIGRGTISAAESRRVGKVTRTAEGGWLPSIARMARTENQFLALDYDGTMWAWGYGAYNMPTPDKDGSEPLPARANHTSSSLSTRKCTGEGRDDLGPVPFHSIWSGNNAAGAVGNNGLLYTWGIANADGVGGSVTTTRCPTLNEGANRVLFQRYPDLYSTADNEIYDENELATEGERHDRYVEIVEAMRNEELEACAGVVEGPGTDTSGCPVRQFGFSTGAAHLLTTEGELLTWVTRPGYGEPFLGRTPTSAAPANRPAPVAGDLRFEEMTSGVSSIVAVSTEGRAYGWGSNNVCQAVGMTTKRGKPAPEDCKDGRNITAATAVNEPTPIDGIPTETPVSSVSATQCAAWATLADGSIYAWGAGTAAGYVFAECRQPLFSSFRGYKIHQEAPDDGSRLFGEPVTDVATETIRTRRG